MIRQVLLAFIPIRYWIALIFAIILISVGGEYIHLAKIIGNVLLIIISVKFAILLHEIGHLLFAKLVGGTPRRMVLGKKHKIVQTTIAGIKIVLHSDFNSGLAYTAFDNLKHIRLKLLLFYSGGFIVNFIIAGCLYFLFGFHIDLSSAIYPISAFGIANLFVGVIALIPYRSTYNGLKITSDGLSILKIPSYKKEDLLNLIYINELLDAYDCMEEKEYKKAITLYENYKHKVDDIDLININLSIAYLKLGDFEKSTSLMETFLPIDENASSHYKSYIYNGLAWNYLLLSKIEEADTYSDIAHKSNYQEKNIKATRGSVLIEKGNFKKGKEFLIEEVDFKYPNNHTLSAAMYLEVAFLKLGEYKKSKKYSAFVKKNIHLLDIDEKMLYDRLQEKITS
ncbi:M50 family metallopeptidase [uncultured Dokdonia sp.]|uniref:M50 family metallopeptidase n=1 Tax=uncultured Dokdonia sp. TaxID=575653 RepID=UPI00260B8698|nr:M50 family metallopeptidase [uncultured Dokdonia sp.]